MTATELVAESTEGHIMPPEDAESLLSAIRSGIANVERDLLRFIEGQGWTALGFASFADCWAARLDGLRLTTSALTAAVVASLYRDTGSIEATQVALRGSAGVMPNTVKHIADQVAMGVPTKAISVRRHDRATATPSSALRVPFGDPEELTQVRAIFEAHGLKLEVEALRAIKREASRLERKGHGNE